MPVQCSPSWAVRPIGSRSLCGLITIISLKYDDQIHSCFNPVNFQYFRTRNNFRIGSGHDDRSNSFLLGHVSFLAGQMYKYDELLFYITHVAD